MWKGLLTQPLLPLCDIHFDETVKKKVFVKIQVCCNIFLPNLQKRIVFCFFPPTAAGIFAITWRQLCNSWDHHLTLETTMRALVNLPWISSISWKLWDFFDDTQTNLNNYFFQDTLHVTAVTIQRPPCDWRYWSECAHGSLPLSPATERSQALAIAVWGRLNRLFQIVITLVI